MSQTSSATVPVPGAAASTPRILIADDNPQGVELLEAYLSSCDYDIRTSADGEETLRMVREWHPDLIFFRSGVCAGLI